mgnify:CR=1 FL=1
MTWVAAGVAVVGGGIKMYQGAQQKKAGKSAEARAQAMKPDFEIPQEEYANLLDAKKAAEGGMPAAQRRAAEQDIQRTSQAALRGSAERKGGLGMVSQVASQESRANLALMQSDVAARRQNIQQMMQQRSVIAGYKQKRFEHEYNEYSADLDYARAQIGAGMQNQMSGIDSIVGGIGQGIAGSIAAAKTTTGDPTALAKEGNPNDANQQPQQKQGFNMGGADKNIFTGKRRQAYNDFTQGTGQFAETDPYMDKSVDPNMTFKEFKKSEYNPHGQTWWEKSGQHVAGWFKK